MPASSAPFPDTRPSHPGKTCASRIAAQRAPRQAGEARASGAYQRRVSRLRSGRPGALPLGSVARVVSTSDREDYRWLGTVPKVREWGQGRLAQGLRVESYSIENLKYEATIEVDRDEISDDQTGQIRSKAR